MEEYTKMFATVSGQTCEGEDFTETLTFTLIPPGKGLPHYGTGYYMKVDMSISGHQLLDVRYERTTDIEILADRFIKKWYGKNAHDVCKQFPAEPKLVPMPGAERLEELKTQYGK